MKYDSFLAFVNGNEYLVGLSSNLIAKDFDMNIQNIIK